MADWAATPELDISFQQLWQTRLLGQRRDVLQ